MVCWICCLILLVLRCHDFPSILEFRHILDRPHHQVILTHCNMSSSFAVLSSIMVSSVTHPKLSPTLCRECLVVHYEWKDCHSQNWKYDWSWQSFIPMLYFPFTVLQKHTTFVVFCPAYGQTHGPSLPSALVPMWLCGQMIVGIISSVIFLPLEVLIWSKSNLH